MPNRQPWMAGAVAAARRANAAEAARHREAKRDEYRAYAAESRACGHEVESFEEWLGEVDPRVAAEARVMGGRSYSEWSYNADQY